MLIADAPLKSAVSGNQETVHITDAGEAQPHSIIRGPHVKVLHAGEKFHLWYVPGHTGYICRMCQLTYEPAEFLILKVLRTDGQIFTMSELYSLQPGKRSRTARYQLLHLVRRMNTLNESDADKLKASGELEW